MTLEIALVFVIAVLVMILFVGQWITEDLTAVLCVVALCALGLASSLSFLTPIGYQTNMMVYGVAQYRFSDFLRFGGPLCLIMLLLSMFVLT